MCQVQMNVPRNDLDTEMMREVVQKPFKTFKLYLVLGSFWLAKDAIKLLRRKKINFMLKIDIIYCTN